MQANFVVKLLKNRYTYVCISGALFLIFKIIRYNKQKTLNTCKKLRPMTVNELLDSKNSNKNNRVIVEGRFGSVEGNWQFLDKNFYLKDSFNRKSIHIYPNVYFSTNIYNGRVGTIDLINPIIRFVIDIILISSGFGRNTSRNIDNYWMYPYLLDNDQVTVFGTFSDNYLIADSICQGNKFVFEEEMRKEYKTFSRLEYLTAGISIFIIARDIIYFIAKKLSDLRLNKYLKASQPIAGIRNENCSKCKNFLKNVVQLDCNHFSFCISCVNEMQRKCPLCNTKIENFYVLQDN
jgi:hypothetical protein